jgi:hypothetical protein
MGNVQTQVCHGRRSVIEAHGAVLNQFLENCLETCATKQHINEARGGGKGWVVVSRKGEQEGPCRRPVDCRYEIASSMRLPFRSDHNENSASRGTEAIRQGLTYASSSLESDIAGSRSSVCTPNEARRETSTKPSACGTLYCVVDRNAFET